MEYKWPNYVFAVFNDKQKEIMYNKGLRSPSKSQIPINVIIVACVLL